MRVGRCLLLGAVFVLVGSSAAFGQAAAMTAAEFERAIGSDAEKAAVARWKHNLPFRMAMTTSSRMDGRPETDWTAHCVTEFAASGAKRTVSESKFGSAPTVTEERVTIGGVNYLRKGDAWTITPDTAEETAANDAASEGKFEKVSSEGEYHLLGTEKIGSETVQVYWKYERELSVDKASGTERLEERGAKYFVTPAGMLLRSEHDSKTTTGTKVIRNAFTIEWQSDPTISIAVPAH